MDNRYLDPGIVKKILELLKENVPRKTIHEITGASLGAIGRYARANGYGKKMRTKEEIENIVSMRRQGFLEKVIREKYNLSRGALHKILKKHAPELILYTVKRKAPVKEMLTANVDEILRRYENGESGIKLAKYYGCDVSNIYDFLRENNVSVRSNRVNSRRYYHDDTYFTVVDTPEKAYWLGFIYADGYVCADRDAMGITLAIKDIGHLQKFLDCLHANNEIHTYTPSENSSNYSTNDYCRVILSGKIKQQLENYGVVEQKTKVLKAPALPPEFVTHFIRGYFDGDGCLSESMVWDKKCGRRFFQAKVKILGTKAMLDYFKSFIESNGVATINKYHKRRKTDKDVFSLELGGNIQVKHFMDLLYADATLYLERKYELYKTLCDYMNSRVTPEGVA